MFIRYRTHSYPHIKCGIIPISNYIQNSNISSTLVGNEIDDHEDVVGASPVDAAPTTSSFVT